MPTGTINVYTEHEDEQEGAERSWELDYSYRPGRRSYSYWDPPDDGELELGYALEVLPNGVEGPCERMDAYDFIEFYGLSRDDIEYQAAEAAEEPDFDEDRYKYDD